MWCLIQWQSNNTQPKLGLGFRQCYFFSQPNTERKPLEEDVALDIPEESEERKVLEEEVALDIPEESEEQKGLEEDVVLDTQEESEDADVAVGSVNEAEKLAGIGIATRTENGPETQSLYFAYFD